MTRRPRIILITASIVLFGLFAVTPTLAGDTYKVLHWFNGKNGEEPASGLTFDTSGNLYGTTFYGGTSGAGTVFQLVRDGNGCWTEQVLHSFCSASNCPDGGYPEAELVFDAAGNLYGTTYFGGPNGIGGGTVFQLVPGPDDTWTENVLYGFCAESSCADGEQPAGPLIFDASGNLYGTTTEGGAHGSGTVFQLVPGADGTWKENVLYSFCAAPRCTDGYYPLGNLIFDSSGNLYGATYYGGASVCDVGCGTVFELTPGKDGTWTEKVIRYFHGSYHLPGGPLIFDRAGNLYGATYEGGGAYGYGIVFELSPSQNGTWTLKVLHWFNGKAGESPAGPVILDAAGNLYGTTAFGGRGSNYGDGVVFEITP